MNEEAKSLDIDWPSDMPEEKRAEWAGVLRAFDAALADFERDPKAIFPSEGERNRLFHASRRSAAKDWETTGPCMHPGCTERSIARSHTIAMSASIKRISEGGHVIAPHLTDKGIEAVSRGIREASTFPGFCDTHELEFADFERAGALSTERHFLLQMFRTLCREIFRMRHHVAKLESDLSLYRTLRRDFAATRMRAADPSGLLKFGELKFDNDGPETQVSDAIRNLTDDLKILDQFYSELSADLLGCTQTAGLSFTVLSLDVELPICLSGMGALNYLDDGIQTRALCLLAVLPEAGQTKIVYGSAKGHMEALQSAFGDKGSLAVIGMIESWMCHGTDHWFMKPSEWNRISEERRQSILDLTLSSESSLADPVDFSILDGVRSEIIAFAERSLATGEVPCDKAPAVSALLRRERRKLGRSDDHL